MSPTGSSPRGSALALAAVLLAVAVWGALYVERTSFEHGGARIFCLWDDAMISMRYARNLVEGYGLVWNPGGERVQGISNPGVTLLMAGLHLLPVAPAALSLAFQLLELAALVATVWLAWRVAWHGLGDAWLALAAALGTATCAPLAIWALQGSDVGFVALWLMIALARVAAAGGAWPRGLFAWLALGIALRADTTIFYAVFLAASLRFPGAARRRFAVGAAGLAAVWGALLLFGWLYYGDPLPNTFYLKATGSPRALVLRAGLLELVFWPLGLLTAVPLAALAVLRERRRPVVPLAAGLVAVALAYNVWVGGDWKGEYGSRFVAPVLPLLALLSAVGARLVAERALAGRAPALRRAALFALALPAALLCSPQRALRDFFDPSAVPLLRAENAANYATAIYLRDHTLPATTLAVHYGGVPPYFGERRAIDVLGKSDRHIARLSVPRFVPGHSKWDWDYVLAQRPDVFLAASRGLHAEPAFRRDYLLVRKAGLRFYWRRDALSKLTDRDGLRFWDLRTRRRVDPRSLRPS